MKPFKGDTYPQELAYSPDNPITVKTIGIDHLSYELIVNFKQIKDPYKFKGNFTIIVSDPIICSLRITEGWMTHIDFVDGVEMEINGNLDINFYK